MRALFIVAVYAALTYARLRHAIDLGPHYLFEQVGTLLRRHPIGPRSS